MANTHWILVSDATRARIFESGVLLDRFVEVEDLLHPESRAKDVDAISDAQGLNRDPHTDRREHEKEVFARELAARLERGLNEHAYQHLVVAAPPQFHGRLLKAISKRVSDAITLRVEKDFTRLPARDLPGALQRYVP
jgi:protein required for attachment to host cells